MIIRPKTRGFVCITAHPQGCAAHVQEQIDTVVRRGPIAGGPKKVEAIRAAARGGRINVLITDEPTAEAILEKDQA